MFNEVFKDAFDQNLREIVVAGPSLRQCSAGGYFYIFILYNSVVLIW